MDAGIGIEHSDNDSVNLPFDQTPSARNLIFAPLEAWLHRCEYGAVGERLRSQYPLQSVEFGVIFMTRVFSSVGLREEFTILADYYGPDFGSDASGLTLAETSLINRPLHPFPIARHVASNNGSTGDAGHPFPHNYGTPLYHW